MTAALPPTNLDALRGEVARLRAELEKYVGHEPTVAEEMAYVRSKNNRLDDLLESARATAVTLEQENNRLQQVIGYLLTNRVQRDQLIVPTFDLDGMHGRAELADIGNGRTQVSYRWHADILAGGAS